MYFKLKLKAGTGASYISSNNKKIKGKSQPEATAAMMAALKLCLYIALLLGKSACFYSCDDNVNIQMLSRHSWLSVLKKVQLRLVETSLFYFNVYWPSRNPYMEIKC